MHLFFFAKSGFANLGSGKEMRRLSGMCKDARTPHSLSEISLKLHRGLSNRPKEKRRHCQLPLDITVMSDLRGSVSFWSSLIFGQSRIGVKAEKKKKKERTWQ